MQDNTNKKRICLIDSMALIYRAHFAFINNPRINSKGQNTSAIFGFINTILDVIEKEKPTHIAAAFDSYEPTLRHEDYSEYKANRDKQPEDISFAIPYIKKILSAMGIPILELPGYEADDLIATISKQIKPEDGSVMMITPDKDYSQLVDDHVFILKPGRSDKPSEIWDKQRVLSEFGIKRVEQVIDIQSLTGDSVDNIPGVPGIGPKTAQSLIEEYDNLENLLANTDKLKGKVKENLEKYADQARMSYHLAKLIINAPVEFNPEKFKKKEWDEALLENLFTDLEFRNLAKRLLNKDLDFRKKETILVQGDLFQQDAQVNEMIELLENDYKEIENIKELEDFLFSANKVKHISIKVFSDGNNPISSKLSGIYLSFAPAKSVYISFVKYPEFLPAVSKLLLDNKVLKIGYNLKSDIIILKNNEIKLSGSLFDNQIAHYLIDADTSHDFERLCENYLKVRQENTDKGKESLAYCDYNIRLYDYFRNEIEKVYKELYDQLESRLIPVLAQMEINGVRIDGDALNDLSKGMMQEMKVLETKIYQLSGISFNINSPQQLGHVLFNILKLDPEAKKTKKSGQYQTGEEVLLKLTDKHEIVNLVMEYRELQKLKSTYLDALPLLVNPVTGLIHTTYEQAVAATGRLSSRNPNLQNIPIRTSRGRQTRKAFIPRSNNNLILSADYSQIELRVVAHASQDDAMIDAFKKGIDIHTSTASKVFGVSQENVTPDMRRKAKEVNFGIIYGISSWGLSQRLGIPKKEGAEIIENYFKNFPGIKRYMDESITKARENGYAETIFGRRRYLRDINSRNAMQRSFAERNAINAPIQGTAADIIKLAMIRLHDLFETNGLESKMIMQVHDELVFDVKKDELETVKSLVKESMEHAASLTVPLLVEMGSGKNWLEAH